MSEVILTVGQMKFVIITERMGPIFISTNRIASGRISRLTIQKLGSDKIHVFNSSSLPEKYLPFDLFTLVQKGLVDFSKL